MNRILRLLLLVCCSIPALSLAHDSNLATLQIIHLGPDRWVFELKTPLYGLDQSLRAYLDAETGEPAELLAGSREYKERLVEYIKAEFDVTATGSSTSQNVGETVTVHPTLGAGRMKLDEHQSTLVFEIQGMPEKLEQLAFRFAYMSHNDAHHTMVRLIDGVRSQRYILNGSNDFQAVDRGFFRLPDARAGAELQEPVIKEQVSAR